tara:strand:- start:412 stop:1782 length:1371 start_codon:yes stop_codon:yes gene_type:complete
MELIYKDEEIDYDMAERLLEEAKREKREADAAEENLRDGLKLSEDWYNYRPFDEIEVLKEISSYYSINLSEAQERISKMPDEPLIDGKPIPEIVKELRQIRRSLKGNAKIKMSNSIDHLIKAYAGHLDSCIENIYWLSPYKSAVKLITPSPEKINKLHYIKDGETRQEIIEHLIKMWECNMKKGETDYGSDYAGLVKQFKQSKTAINTILKNIHHQSIRPNRKKKLDDMLVKAVCSNPGITSNHLHAILPNSYKRSTSPQTIAKMLKRLDVTNVEGEYYLISNEIKKDLFSYIAGFIDSDGYITMDPSFSPRVGMIATGNRGRAFFTELEKELNIGRLHLDQKVGENSRSQHRLNFYSQDDITKLLDKCLPHLRMKQTQGRLLQEAIRIKKNYKKQPWAKERMGQIFKLMKWENWKDARNKTEFEKYNILEEDIAKYKQESKWELMDELDSIVKEE